MTKRRRKQSKEGDSGPPSEVKKTKKEKGEGRRGYRKSSGGPGVKGGLGGQASGKMGSIQSLLNAATLLEGERDGGKGLVTGSSWKELWNADSRCVYYCTVRIPKKLPINWLFNVAPVPILAPFSWNGCPLNALFM